MSSYCNEHDTWDRCKQDRWLEQQRNPYVGQPATLCYPDDRYPLKVVSVSPKGKRITLTEVHLSRKNEHSEGEHFPVVTNVSEEDDLPSIDGRTVAANWSEKHRSYMVAGTTPIALGYARYRRDWSL